MVPLFELNPLPPGSSDTYLSPIRPFVLTEHGVVVDNEVVVQLQFDHGRRSVSVDIPHDADFHAGDHDIAAFIQSSMFAVRPQ